ncbi:hypothetical protein NA78x_005645 [Anatilimnocola sp. NA78]|uniref:hypothetical protein n=1 Tax=Anatilimnocola sp. NA78 TaxID=3415683 RepID=UPI003CE5B24B
MPKFYVSSGNLNLIVEADHARAAAIWAVHRCLSPVAPFMNDEDDAVECQAVETLSYESAQPTRKLGDTICVSERGFGNEDQREFATLPIVAEWSRLLVAIDRLQQELCE